MQYSNYLPHHLSESGEVAGRGCERGKPRF